MALHAGEVNYDDYGVTGASVNLTFRLLEATALKAALAGSPGVLAVIASSWFFEEVIRHTPEAASFRPVPVAVKETAATGWMWMPEHMNVTGRESPVALEPAVPVPAAQPASVLRALPRDVATFTGRARELEYLAAAASRDGEVISIHAVNGMAGVGKTAFAVHVAHRLADLFPDGQIFLRLHAHTPGQRPVDPADALSTLLLAVGVAPWHIPPGLEARSAAWRSHLAGKRALLVFDDASGSDQVRPLLPGSADCLVLVTSRRRLTALEAVPVSLDTLPPSEAAELFTCAAARPGLEPGDSGVAEVVRLCGCLPLAIHLLAGRLCHHPARTVRDLAREMSTARNRLAAMQAEDISVAAAFDLSYQDLIAGQQKMFRHLGLHPGTDLDTYAAAAMDDAELGQARRDIEALYDQHLLIEQAPGRYRMHDLIREHARSLAESDPAADRDAALDRLLEYYLRSARAAGMRLARRIPGRPPLATATPPGRIPDPPAYEDQATWIDTERHNLRAAVSYAALHGRSRSAAAIAAEMHGFLRMCGDWETALTLNQVAAKATHEAGDLAAEAGARADLGDMQYLTESYRQATRTLSRALDLYRGLDFDTRLEEANVLTSMGHPLNVTGNPSAGMACQQQALGLYRDLSNPLGQATALNRLGVLQANAGLYPQATTGETRALSLYRSLGNPLGEAHALGALGDIQSVTGDLQPAAVSLARALELHHGIGNVVGEVNVLMSLGALQTITGDYQAAFASFEQALEGDHRLRRGLGEAEVLCHLGTLHRLTGDYAAAAAALTRAIELQRYLGYPLGEAVALNTKGELSLESGSLSDAQASHEKAHGIARAVQSLPEEARALEGIGRCHLHDGQHAAGTRALHEALTIYQRIGSPAATRVKQILDEHGI
ncbi:MAG: tetratricopeptide repeat protein [Streptosporangiaceae bacterium]|jgi:tetratricopeptide (TPR) repeat protein